MTPLTSPYIFEGIKSLIRYLVVVDDVGAEAERSQARMRPSRKRRSAGLRAHANANWNCWRAAS